MSEERTPEKPTTYGTIDDTIILTSKSLSSHAMRQIAGNYNRMASRAEPMFGHIWPAHDLDTVFGTASVPLQTACHRQAVSVLSWQLVVPPVPAVKKAGLNKMYAKLGFSITAPGSVRAKALDFQIVTSKNVLSTDERGSLASPNILSTTSASTSGELYDINISSGLYEQVYLFAKAKADHELVYAGGAAGAMGADHGTVLAAKDTSTLLLSGLVAMNPADGHTFATFGTYVRILNPYTGLDAMPPRIITGASDGVYMLDQYISVTPSFTDSEMRRITQSNIFTVNRLDYKVCFLPRLTMRYFCAVAQARSV